MINIVILFTASILIWLMVLGLIILWLFDGKFNKELVLHAIVACLFAWIGSLFLKDIFDTTRPYVTEGVKYLVFWIPSFEAGAFPSGHAASSFALSITIWFHDKKVGSFYIFASIMIGVARVIANVHYPIDILGGAILGILIAFLIEKIHIIPTNKKLKQRG